jgi:hypothetical protein
MKPVQRTELIGDGAKWALSSKGAIAGDALPPIPGLSPGDAEAIGRLIEEQLRASNASPPVDRTASPQCQPSLASPVHEGREGPIIALSSGMAEPPSPAAGQDESPVHHPPSPSPSLSPPSSPPPSVPVAQLHSSAEFACHGAQSAVFSAEPSAAGFSYDGSALFTSGSSPDFSSLLLGRIGNVTLHEDEDVEDDQLQPDPSPATRIDLYDPVSILPRLDLTAGELMVGDAIDLEKEFEAFAVAEQTALRVSTRRHRSVDMPEAGGGPQLVCDGSPHPVTTARRSALQLAYQYPLPLPPKDVAAARRRDLLRRTDPIRTHHIEEVLDGSTRNAVAAENLRREYTQLVTGAFRPDERAYHDALLRKLEQQTAKVGRLRASLAAASSPKEGATGSPPSCAPIERDRSPGRKFETNKDALTSLRTRTALASQSREHVATMDVAWSAFMADLERRKGQLEVQHLDAYFPR